jgi:hypothetical protein
MTNTPDGKESKTPLNYRKAIGVANDSPYTRVRQRGMDDFSQFVNAAATKSGFEAGKTAFADFWIATSLRSSQ